MRRIVGLIAFVALCCLSSSAFAQGFGRGGGNLSLLRSATVQAELTLTAEQKAQLSAIGDEARTQFQGLRDLPDEERRAKIRELTEQFDGKVNEVLDDAQEMRLLGISLQFSGPLAASEAKYAEALGITEEQKKLIEPLAKEYDDQQRTMRQQAQQGGDRRAMFEKMLKLREEIGFKVEALFTTEQRKKWGEMLGTAIDKQKIRGEQSAQ